MSHIHNTLIIYTYFMKLTRKSFSTFQNLQSYPYWINQIVTYTDLSMSLITKSILKPDWINQRLSKVWNIVKISTDKFKLPSKPDFK